VIAQNSPLNETAGLAHVPFINRTSWAGQGVWAPNYCDDQIARGEIAVLRSFHNLPQRLVSQDKSFLSRRRDADTVDGDFRIGAADSD
jgi:hypothetical protein